MLRMRSVLRIGLSAFLALTVVTVARGDVLAFVESETVDVDDPREVVVSPDGSHAYVVNHQDDSVSSYSIAAGGELTQIDVDTSCGGDGLDQAGGIAISPDGAHVYVVARMEDAIIGFARVTIAGPTFGQLGCVGRVAVGSHPSGVAVSPDGANVYATSTGPENDVAVFTRNAGTGVLTAGSFVDDGVGGSIGVAVSPDGAHVYVVGSDSIAWFSRGAGGALTYLDTLEDDGTVALGGAARISFSPDGLQLYVAAANDDAIGVFGRDAGSGDLTPIETESASGQLDGAVVATVSADGSSVYSAAAVSGTLASFARSSSGHLTAIQTLSGNGLDGATSVAVSPDGRCVYVAAASEDAIVVYCVDDEASDFGDAPDGYGTSLAANGARHAVDALVFLGASVDAEPDGLPSAGADGDDLDGTDDEDGVTFLTALVSGGDADIEVESNVAALLDGWIDVDADGAFETAERILSGEPLLAGTNPLSFAVPGGVTGTSSSARFRLRAFPSDGPLDPTGPGGIGEVEDYAVTLAAGSFTLDVALDGTGSGLVTSAPSGIGCAGDCTEDYLDGTLVTLTATATVGSVFAGWSDPGCPGTGSCDVTLDADQTVTATFDAIVHALTVAVTGPGSVASDVSGIACPGDCTESFNEGAEVVLTATPDAGQAFAGWGGDCTGTGTCNLTMDAAKAVTAEFLPAADLSVVVSDSGTPPDDGDPFTVTITVTNAGPSAIIGAQLASVFPTSNFEPGSLSWTCAAQNAAICDLDLGALDLDETIDLPIGGVVVYTVSFVAPDPAFGHIETSATITLPAGFADSTPADNSDSEITGYLKIFFDDFESGDVTRWSASVPL